MYFTNGLTTYFYFYLLFFFAIGSLLLFFIIICYTKKSKMIDITQNQDNVNILEIKNLQDLITPIPDVPPVVDFTSITPSHLIISDIGNEEWGLKVNRGFKKGELIHTTPLSFFSSSYDTKIITPIGEKYIYPATHSCIKILDREVFAYWDTLLNHNYLPNCYYSPYLRISNGQWFVSLYAVKDINAGDELYINYIGLLFFYAKLYGSLLFSNKIKW